ncbi:MAG: hypothetical protein BWK76_23260 [Desulfobulbaceae bacterium A2]|nr:MAG: hypothetical protein BWK76_23260 [Desulfobulbaceae bacterium A2]
MQAERLVSLDAFRGATVAAMILVNNPGLSSHVYPPLAHAAWNGWTCTDCIFPFFLWIVGVSLAFSLAARTSRGATRSQLVLVVLRRSVLLFALGLFLSGFPFGVLWQHTFSWATIRIPGVLQRIAVCYCLAALVTLCTRQRGQIVAIGVLCVSYWLMMQFFPVPEIGAGHYEKGQNFAAYVDSLVLSGHMWSASKTWDPEGIISTLPAIATTLFGVVTGRYLRHCTAAPEEKSAWMCVAGAGFLLFGMALDPVMPINKSLWTVSFAIFMHGMALCVFALVYYVIDANGRRKWAYPCVVFGMNAISVFVLAGGLGRIMGLWKLHVPLPDGTSASLAMKAFLFQQYFAPYFSPRNASLAYALTWVGIMYLVAWVMYKKNVFMKI